MDKTTDKGNVQMLARLCALKGLRHVVVSPGSRNAPLVVAFNREQNISCHVIVDERSAAYFALGIAQQTEEPVGLICTSGTALLNYGPGIAEAYYQRIPLLVMSADRPEEWIDQDDSQTVRQFKCLDSIVKASYQLPVESVAKSIEWYVNRTINEAFNRMTSGRKGPVHLNIPLEEPLCGLMGPIQKQPRIFNRLNSNATINDNQMNDLAIQLTNCPKIMILASMHSGSEKLQKALSKLAQLPQVVVMTESIANVQDKRFVGCIDRTLCRLPKEVKEQKLFFPDILISYGGAVISKMLKGKLKEFVPREHWYIGEDEQAIDTFCSLSLQVNTNPLQFFSQLAPLVKANDSTFNYRWSELVQIADLRHKEYVDGIGWCDLKAFSHILKLIPANSRLQLSNGTSVRYHQLFKNCKANRVNANRGTSGIDGSTSTAAGAAIVYDGYTTLITGDISFLYDSNALWNSKLSKNLKIILINNGGGGIFRFIQGPKELPELEEFFETPHQVEIHQLAAAYGLNYLCAQTEKELKQAMRSLYAWEKPTILEVVTPREINDVILRNYFK